MLLSRFYPKKAARHRAIKNHRAAVGLVKRGEERSGSDLVAAIDETRLHSAPLRCNQYRLFAPPSSCGKYKNRIWTMKEPRRGRQKAGGRAGERAKALSGEFP